MAPTVDSLREALAVLSLDTRGHKDVLSRRLARHKKAQREAATPLSPATTRDDSLTGPDRPRGQAFDAYLCFDVEATCEHFMGQHVAKQAFSWPNEIIEFPVILLKWCKLDRIRSTSRSCSIFEAGDPRQEDAETDFDRVPSSSEEEGTEDEDEADPQRWELRIVDEFHSFVRPKHRPKLSDFCHALTGITQAQVDSAPYYPQVLKRFKKQFITKHNLFSKEVKTVWVTDGPWDLRDFVAKQVFLSNMQRPPWLGGHVIDLRKLVTHYFAGVTSPPVDPTATTKTNGSPPPKPSIPIPIPIPTTAPESLSIPCVLSALCLPPFIGHLHSGLDDARNLSRILVELARRGVGLDPNLTVPIVKGREKRWDWMGREGSVVWERVWGFEQVKKGETGDR